MKILFLDIDGVLNSGPYLKSLTIMPGQHQEIRDYHVQLLSEICHKHRAKIVLCSTWRVLDSDHSPVARKMWLYLQECLQKHNLTIFSKTPVLGGNRPLEIKTWLTNHYDIESFVILDDDFPLEEYRQYGLERNLVKTKYFCEKIEDGGLQRGHFGQINDILTGNGM